MQTKREGTGSQHQIRLNPDQKAISSNAKSYNSPRGHDS